MRTAKMFAVKEDKMKLFDFNDEKTRKELTKWVLTIAGACILMYLALRHLPDLAAAVAYLADILLPILIGAAVALVLNVPLRIYEAHVLPNAASYKLRVLRRVSGILFSIILVLGIFVGAVAIVIPTLADACVVVYHLVLDLVEDISAMRIDLSQLPFGAYLQQLDWNSIVTRLEAWATVLAGNVMDAVWGFIGSLGGALMDLFVGVIFGVYVLGSKEKLQKQFIRLVKVWLPEKCCSALLYGASVCSETFHLFIAGQTLEAVILGGLCALGMSLLNIPYAAMVGVLVGVTALIPYVGAFIGMGVGAFVILTVSPVKALIFVVYLLVLQQVEGNLIYPKVVGAKLNLPAIWVLAAIAVGGNVAGPLGMLVAVPVAASAYIILKETTAKREENSHKCVCSEEKE